MINHFRIDLNQQELKPMDSLPFMKRKMMEPRNKALEAAAEMDESNASAAKRASTPLGLSSAPAPPPAPSATAATQPNGRGGARRGSVDSASHYAAATVPVPTHSPSLSQHTFVKSSFAKRKYHCCHDHPQWFLDP